MPDITMCDGGDCPSKANCYRHTAAPNPWWQSYFVEPPFNAGNSCDHFTPNVLREQSRSGHYLELERVY